MGNTQNTPQTDKAAKDIFEMIPPADGNLSILIPEYARDVYDTVLKQVKDLNYDSLEIDTSQVFTDDLSEEEIFQRAQNLFMYVWRYWPFEPEYTPMADTWAENLAYADDLSAMTLQLNYRYSKEVNLRNRELVEAKIEEIVSSLPDTPNDIIRLFHLFRWLVVNVNVGEIPSDYAGFDQIEGVADFYTAKGALVDRRAWGGGLVLALKKLCDKAGIYCRVVPADTAASVVDKDIIETLKEKRALFLRDAGIEEKTDVLADVPNHALCFVVVNGKPFYCDPLVGCMFRQLEQNTGKTATPRFMGFALGAEMLRCYNVYPRLPETLDVALLENEYTDISQYGIYYHCRQYDLDDIKAFIIPLLQKDSAAFIAFDNTEDKERFLEEMDDDAVRAINAANEVQRMWTVFSHETDNVCIVKPVG